jgi:flap endonuclease-1
MGIKNLMKVLNDHTSNAINSITYEELKNKKIAIDTSIILYQYVSAIRTSGSDLKNSNGKSTSHILGILVKTLNYLKLDIIPVHIFDGKPPELKIKVLNDRNKTKKEAINKLLELEDKLKDLDTDDEDKLKLKEQKIKYLQQSVSISQNEMIEAYEIAKLLGVPTIIAKEEADTQCAYLSREGLVDYVATEDMDILTFGAKSIIRNFSKKEIYKVELNKILEEGNISMDQFIDICILLGCDYTETISGIGIKKVWNLILKYGSIEELIKNEKKIIENKYKLPDNFRYLEAREYFKNPIYIDMIEEDLKLKLPKLNELKTLLIKKYNFMEDNIEKMIGFLRIKYNIYDKYDDYPFIDI